MAEEAPDICVDTATIHIQIDENGINLVIYYDVGTLWNSQIVGLWGQNDGW